MIRTIRLLPIGLLSLLVAALAGCGASPAKVSGKVTIKGQPLKGGFLSFVNKSSGGRHFAATIQKDGTYKIDDMLTGDYIVVVDTKSLLASNTSNAKDMMAKYAQMSGGKSAPASAKKGQKNEPPKDAKLPEGYEMTQMQPDLKSMYTPIPDEYSDEKTSKLSITVQKGDQVHNFEL
jgi:hypothetical protein